jgi:hypothetical protein
MLFWLDASDATTITESGGAVSAWNDKSPNGINFSQAIAANRPTTNTQTLNGKNVIVFDGSNDRLEGTNTTVVRSILAVVYINSSAQFKTIVGAKTSASGSNDAFYFQSTANVTGAPAIAVADTSNTAIRAGGTTLTVPGHYILAGTVDDISTTRRLTMAINLRPENSATSLANFKPYGGDMAVGAGYFNRNVTDFFNGHIAEIVAYSRKLEPQEIQTVRQYLNSKWRVY